MPDTADFRPVAAGYRMVLEVIASRLPMRLDTANGARGRSKTYPSACPAEAEVARSNRAGRMGMGETLFAA